MKTNKFLFGAAVLALTTSALISACSGQGGGSSEKTRVQKVVEQAEKMSREDLFKKAAEELGSQTFHWYATSSRGGKVKDKFVAELNKAGGTNITADQIDYQTTVDGRIYTILNAEIESGKQVTSVWVPRFLKGVD